MCGSNLPDRIQSNGYTLTELWRRMNTVKISTEREKVPHQSHRAEENNDGTEAHIRRAQQQREAAEQISELKDGAMELTQREQQQGRRILKSEDILTGLSGNMKHRDIRDIQYLYLINNKKMSESKNITGVCVLKAVDSSFIKQAGRLREKNNAID